MSSGLLDRDGFPSWFDVELNGPGWYDENLVDAAAAADVLMAQACL